MFLSSTAVFDLFPSELVVGERESFLRLIKTFSERLKNLKNSKRKCSYCNICIRLYRKSQVYTILNRRFRPFPGGVRLQDQRRLFAPHQGLFRTVKKFEKLQPEVELFPVLYKIYLKIIRISVFHLNLRPFLVRVRLWCLRTVFAPV